MENKKANHSIIPSILSSNHRAALVLAGGGTGALHSILQTAGASRFILDAQIPYSPAALEKYTGGKIEHAVSIDAVKKMADVALQTAGATMGIAVTAALQTDRRRRGDDRALICIKTAGAEKLFSLHFSPAARAEQEKILSDWILILIAHAAGVARGLILPGSFNPLHCGHIKLLRAAGEITGLSGIFELSCANVDKAGVDESECLCRAAAVRDIPVALTAAPRFVQKAALFPQTVFALGFDTVVRLIDYAALEEWTQFKNAGAEFLVAGRMHNGAFKTLRDIQLPENYKTLFREIPEKSFHEDISSTELRNAGA